MKYFFLLGYDYENLDMITKTSVETCINQNRRD